MQTQSDLDLIEQYARKAATSGGDRRLIKSCLALVREVRFWRGNAHRDFAVVMACPQCDYEVEIGPPDFFGISDRSKQRCRGCGSVLKIRVKTPA
jgi:hypothetical protein